MTANDDERSIEDDLKRRRRFPILHFASNLFFVVGSVLYLVLAIEDHAWGKTLQKLPIWLRTADDDTVWMNYRLEEHHNASLEAGGAGARGGNDDAVEQTRRLQFEMYQNFGIPAGNEETDSPTASPPAEEVYGSTTIATTTSEYLTPEQPDGEPYSTIVINIDELEGIGSEVEEELEDQTLEELEDQTLLLPNVTYDEMDFDDDASTSLPTYETEVNSNTILNLTAVSNTTDNLNFTGPALDTTAQYLDTTTPTIKPALAPSLTPSTVLTTTDPLQPTDAPLVVSRPEDETTDGGADNSENNNDQPAPALVPSPKPSPAPTAAIVAATPAPGLTPEELYYDEWWADLPPDIQAAYTVLGYTEAVWNFGGYIPAEDLWWDELSPEQQEAALYIGYTKEIWNGDGTPAPTLFPTAHPTAVIFVYPPNNSTTTNTTFASADDELQEAIMPEEIQEDSTTIPESVDPGYYDYFWWAELPPEIQDAATELGYDQGIWDSGGLSDTEELYWDELSPSQQHAAALLGYDQYSWDEVDPTTGESISSGDEYVSYDDDYVFQVAATGTWVSRYMILYFVAALCFVFVGALDLIREKHAFHILMIIAGLTGVASAMLVEKDVQVSNILDCISVHFFFLEATTLFGSHRRAAISTTNTTPKLAILALAFADLNFVLGSLIDVIVSLDAID
jgi:hypothetical protein